MSPGARALVEYLAEQLAATEIERKTLEPAPIDRTPEAEQNAASTEDA